MAALCFFINFSALQRAEIAETTVLAFAADASRYFSALQRAEIAEISALFSKIGVGVEISVLFNEPKLLKQVFWNDFEVVVGNFSALQRAEIAETCPTGCRRAAWSDISVLFNEPKLLKGAGGAGAGVRSGFQCSSTSRNC